MKRWTITIKIKEPISALTHFFGILFSIVALVLLVTYASLYASVWHVISFAIFGGCAITLYTFSTLYHWLPLKIRYEKIFRRLDHSSIYLMIAGTYTPVCLVALKETWRWGMLTSIWGMAVVGILLSWTKNQALFRRKLSSLIYLGMGWFAVVALYPIYKAIAPGGMFWLLMGGALYTIGAVIYRTKKPDFFPKVFGFHEVFHLFILGGTFCHFWLMFGYVLNLTA